MSQLTVAFEQEKSDAATTNRLLVRSQGTRGRIPREATADFVHEGNSSLPEPRCLDGYMLGVLMLAMQHVDTLLVEGPISAKALRNARVWGEAWHAWFPHLYSPVDIRPESVVAGPVPDEADSEGRPERAISAFSGGVDSLFVALRHSQRLLGDASYPLDTGLLVHGFDVRRENESAFEELLGRVMPVTDELGIDLKVVRTNVKTSLGQRWEHAHSSILASVLHQFSHDFGYALVGSTMPYDRPVLGWGSNPATDYLLSGADIDIVHEGAGFSRVEKVELIAKHPDAHRALKVCWQGADQGRNCGVCEKCVGTRLAFMAVGLDNPECFDGPLDPDLIQHMRIPTDLHRHHLVATLEYAESRGIHEPWLDSLAARVAGDTTRRLSTASVGPAVKQRRPARSMARRVRRRLRNLR